MEFFRSVLKLKPVSFYIDILGIITALSPQKRYVNKVFDLCRNKTGFKNKKDITDAIDILRKNAIITKSKVTKQKEMIEFLPLGKELTKLIDDIENHKTAYSQLKKQIKEHFDISQDNVTMLSTSQLRHRLGQKGWKSDELDKYYEWLEEVFHLEYYSYFAIFSALIARYASIIFRYNPDALAKDILNKLVIDALRDRLLARSQGLLSEKVLPETKEIVLYTLVSQLAGVTNAYFSMYAPPVQLNRFLREASENTVKSLYNLLSPPPGYLRWTRGREASKDRKAKQQLEFLEGLDKSA